MTLRSALLGAVWAAPVALLVAFACSSGEFKSVASSGGTGSTEPGTGGGSSKFEEYMRLRAEAVCQAVTGCAEFKKDTIVELVGTATECQAFIVRAFTQMPENRGLAAAVVKGSVVFKSEKLEGCLTRDRTCLIQSDEIEHVACREVFEGTAATGDSCYLHQECAGDAYCAALGDGGVLCPGVCTPRKPAGSSCSSTAECATTTDYARCEAGVCRALRLVPGAPRGAACGDTAPGEHTLCQTDLWCGEVGTTANTCQLPIAQGGACEDDFDVCAAGLFCDHDTTPGSCQPVTVVNELGGACDSATLTFCNMYELSCVNGVCQSAGDGSLGSACQLDTYSCNRGLFCDSNDTCQPERAAGESCTSGTQCKSGSCSASSVCEERYCGAA